VNLKYVRHAVGGQGTRTVKVRVDKGDIIVCQGTASTSNCTITWSGVPARLHSTWVGGTNNRLRHSVWEALGSGTASVTVGGSDRNRKNLDLVACVTRPTQPVRGTIVVEGTFDGTSPWPILAPHLLHLFRPHSVETPVKEGEVLFITQTGGGGVAETAQTSGITFVQWYNELPEGATSQENGRMIARKATSSGTAVTSGGSAWILVTVVREEFARRRRTGFVMV
jgi:hypothetical protein